MRPNKRLLFVGLFLLLISFTVQAAPPDYQSKTLPNQIRMVYQVLPEAKTVVYRIVAPVGFINEPENIRGISHLLEHTVFRGNETYSNQDVERCILDEGGLYNGGTSLKITEYFFEVPAEKFAAAMPVLTNCVMKPALRESDVALEKKIVTVEKFMRERPDVGYLFFNQITDNMLDESVEAIERETIARYHRQAYQPKYITVIVTGKFNPDEVAAVLSKYENEEATQLPPARIPEMGQEEDILLEDYLLGEKYQLLLGYELKDLSERELTVAKVLPEFLSYGTRRYDNVQDKPLDYYISFLELGSRKFIVFYYRDCKDEFSFETNAWHNRTIVRYFKYLQNQDYNGYLSWIKKIWIKRAKEVELGPSALNDYYKTKLFYPENFVDVNEIKRLKSKDFKGFVEKHLLEKKPRKIVLKAL